VFGGVTGYFNSFSTSPESCADLLSVATAAFAWLPVQICGGFFHIFNVQSLFLFSLFILALVFSSAILLFFGVTLVLCGGEKTAGDLLRLHHLHPPPMRVSLLCRDLSLLLFTLFWWLWCWCYCSRFMKWWWFRWNFGMVVVVRFNGCGFVVVKRW
jgi:hypothetical protein